MTKRRRIQHLNEATGAKFSYNIRSFAAIIEEDAIDAFFFIGPYVLGPLLPNAKAATFYPTIIRSFLGPFGFARRASSTGRKPFASPVMISGQDSSSARAAGDITNPPGGFLEEQDGPHGWTR